MNNRDALLTPMESRLFFFRILTLGSLFGWPSDRLRHLGLSAAAMSVWPEEFLAAGAAAVNCCVCGTCTLQPCAARFHPGPCISHLRRCSLRRLRCALTHSYLKSSRWRKSQCPLWRLLDCEFLLASVHLRFEAVYDR